MARHLLTLLNDVLTWVNPLLGCVAAMLVLLVFQAADDHFARHRTSPVVATRTVSVECQSAALPRELQELLLYD